MNSKGFATIIAIIIAILVIGGVVYVVQTRKANAPVAPASPVAATIPATPDAAATADWENNRNKEQLDVPADWKTYEEGFFSLRYPPEYDFIFVFCDKTCHSQNIKGSSDSSIQVTRVTKGVCYLNSCTASVKQDTFSGITWDHLGSNTLTNSGLIYVYRTTHLAYDYYVLFNKDLPINTKILGTFQKLALF